MKNRVSERFNGVNKDEVVFVDFEMTVGRDINDIKCHKDISAEESPDGEAKIGDRIWQVALLKARKDSDGQWVLTGEKYEVILNPGIHIVPSPKDGYIPKFINEHGEKQDFTDDVAKNYPKFEDEVDNMLDFIGDRRMVITCWEIMPNGEPFVASLDNMKAPEGSHVRDVDFFNEELKRAGREELPRDTFYNVKSEFSVVMGGNKASSLRNVVPYCFETVPNFAEKAGFTLEEYQDKKHDAIIDTKALVAVVSPIHEKFEKMQKEHQAKIVSAVKPSNP